MGEPSLHPDMEIIFQARDASGDAGTTPVEARAFWTRYTAATSELPPADMTVSDTTVPGADFDVPVRIYRPADAGSTPPAIVYFHGGGFMLGDLDSSDSFAWDLADGTGALVASADYRLAPEHPFPAAFDDSFAVLDWLGTDAGGLGVDTGRIAVAGESAGGNLAAGLALAARERDGPALAAQAIVYPCTGIDLELPSYTDFAEGTGLTTANMIVFRDAYTPDAAGLADWRAWPAVAADFSDLPPALVHTAEIDPIRDEGRDYAAKLARAGVDVTYREARRMIHGFTRARFAGADARAEFDAICEFLKGHLTS